MANSIDLSTIPWGGFLSKIMYWAGYAIVITIVIAVFYAIWWYTSYPYKMTYWPVTGNVNGAVSADRPRRNKVKWNKAKTAWRVMMPWGNKKEIEPFQPDHIYPGRNLYAFKLGEAYLPAQLKLDNGEFNIRPIPYSVRNWQMVELKQNEEEFKKKNLWEENKYFFMVIITAVACCAVVGVTVYYTYQYAQNNLAETASTVQRLAQTIKAPG